MTTVWASFLATLLMTNTGCEAQPQAPLLRDSPVYHATSEGFRFRVPEGWKQAANAVLPPGKLPGDIFLTRFQVQTTEGGASLQIICRNDLPASELEKHWSGPSFGVKEWKPIEPLREIKVGGLPGERLVYSGQLGDKTLVKQVTCLHRNDRLYSFVGLFWANDEFARQQIERALESLIW